MVDLSNNVQGTHTKMLKEKSGMDSSPLNQQLQLRVANDKNQRAFRLL